MRIREAGYKEYGITKSEEKEILSFCRKASQEDREFISLALQGMDADIAPYIFMSLVDGKSYERLDAMHWLPISKVDFYGYRRLGVFLIKESAIREDEALNRIFKETGVIRRICKVEEVTEELQISPRSVEKIAMKAEALLKLCGRKRIDMNALYSYIDNECKAKA